MKNFRNIICLIAISLFVQGMVAAIIPIKRNAELENFACPKTEYQYWVDTKENYGRDHHPRCFTIWMAGGGVKPGVYGETDEFGYNIASNPVHVNDFHATALHLMGLDHEKLTFKHLGRRYRLTDVAGKVVSSIIA